MTTLTAEDLERAAPLARALLVMLSDEGTPPGEAAAALAIVLGSTCKRFGIDPRHARMVLDVSYEEATS